MFMMISVMQTRFYWESYMWIEYVAVKAILLNTMIHGSKKRNCLPRLTPICSPMEDANILLEKEFLVYSQMLHQTAGVEFL